MKPIFALSTTLLLGIAACGGGEPAAEPAAGGTAAPAAEPAATQPAGGLTNPDWYSYDEATNSVTLDLVAGQTNALNYWNYNGLTGGSATIVVPEGATVTINFSNQDPNMAHSVGVSPLVNPPPAAVDPTPVFEGAISTNPTSMVDSTMPGQSETITFTASQAGEYALTCYIPGHAVTGMWLGFTVSASGEAGVR